LQHGSSAADEGVRRLREHRQRLYDVLGGQGLRPVSDAPEGGDEPTPFGLDLGVEGIWINVVQAGPITDDGSGQQGTRRARHDAAGDLRVRQEFLRIDPDRPRQSTDGVDRDISLGPLDGTDVGSMDPGDFGEAFLRQPLRFPEPPQVRRDPLPALDGVVSAWRVSTGLRRRPGCHVGQP